ncbi:hypothetical protein J6O48_08295 [bacterium]|nr:hypothetical protein [bacterium]
MNTYDIFAGKDLEIAELIQQRRYQILVHSCIYYVMSNNIISDRQWDEWAKELKTLQENYPEISKKTPLYEYFNDWDASTGEFLPIREQWVINLANYVLKLCGNSKVEVKVKKSEQKVAKRRLF